MRVTTGRAATAALALFTGAAGAVIAASPASAAPSGASSTTTTTVTAGDTVPLQGLGVTVDDAEQISVTLATTRGDLAIDTSTGIVLAYGYSASGPEIAFTGTGAEVNAALDAVTLTTSESDKGASATLSVMATPSGDVVFSPTTGHFYEFVVSPSINWQDAKDAAASRTYGAQAGYLATVPNAAVNELIASRIPDATNVWLGGKADDSGSERIWKWEAGPLAGNEFSRCSTTAYIFACDFIGSADTYRNWALTEPNNYRGVGAPDGEGYMVTNWQVSSGQPAGEWNDLPANANGISGYVVEYGNNTYGAMPGFTGVVHASATVPIVGVPFAPSIDNVASGNHSLAVTFTPAGSGGAPVSGYKYSLDGGTSWSVGLLADTSSPLVIYGVENDVPHQVAIRAVSAAGDGEPSASMPGTAAAAPVDGPGHDADGTLPELDPGLAGALVNGTTVGVSSGASGDVWRVATSQASVTLAAFDADSLSVPIVDGSSSFEGIRGGYVMAEGAGFKPGSTVNVWLFSMPVLLGVQTVKSDGTFSAMLALPSTTPAGQHTIQVNGLTASSETLSASMGVRVASARSTLAATGADIKLFPAALLVGLGVALLAVSRSRQRRTRR
jgi:hypothetical protein